MKRTSRNWRMAALVLAACLTAASALAREAEGGDDAVPRVVSVRLDPPAVVGRTAALRVSGQAGTVAVSGMVVRFGRGESFGLSACSAGYPARPPAPPFAPGSRIRFTALHVFSRPGARRVLIRLDAGGCAVSRGSVFQPVVVTPTRPGEPPVPPTADPPLPGPGAPEDPDTGDLPPLGVAPPALPALPSPAAGPARRRLRCPGASRRVRRTVRSVRAARRSFLCLLNAHRRDHGVRSLRPRSGLRRAATGHSRAMVLKRFFSHVQPSGLGLEGRVRRTRYLAGVRTWTVAENIGYGRGRYSAPTVQMRAWLRSTGHRANILDARFSEVGLGIVRGVPGRPRARGATYTAVFGRRR